MTVPSDGSCVYISNWGGSILYVINPATGAFQSLPVSSTFSYTSNVVVMSAGKTVYFMDQMGLGALDTENQAFTRSFDFDASFDLKLSLNGDCLLVVFATSIVVYDIGTNVVGRGDPTSK
jgi:hypothetical protein